MSTSHDGVPGVPEPGLIRTKLQRPRLGRDLIPRPQLIEKLNQGLEHKLTVISAQAGAGKTTLLAQWLEERPEPSAWLSLDKHDNDLMVFTSYLCAAIRTTFPDACEDALGLLNAPQTPPPRIITASLVNELDTLFASRDTSTEADSSGNSFVLALDDFQSIKEPTVHNVIENLIAYLPQSVHLAIASRTDPPLPLAGLRARGEMNELRMDEMRFSREEAKAFLEKAVVQELRDETIDLLEDRTEGWIVGLRLVALSMRHQPDVRAFAQRFEGTSSSVVVDYLVSEVLYQLSPTKQDFLLRTSILDRMNAELCDAIMWPRDDTLSTRPGPGSARARSILEEIRADNLFLVPLDQAGNWFRYHHLFGDLLRHRLQRKHSPEEIAALHNRASRWFEENEWIEEAIAHAFSAGQPERAAQIVARKRHSLMNQTRWQQLDRYLRRFPSEIAEQQPELLMLKSWLLYHQGHYGQLPAVLERLEATLQAGLSPIQIRHLKGEISALRSLLYYYQTNVERTISEAEFSIENTAPELWIVRILARLFLAGAFLMKGEQSRAYAAIYQGADEEVVHGDSFKATMQITICNVHWVAADLQGLVQTAKQCIQLYDREYSPEISGYAHYHLGCAYYHLNDLARAEEHFVTVVQQPYMNYGDCFAHSAFGVSLTYQAQNRPDEAREVAALAVAHLVETGNTTLLPVARAFQAEIALRQSQLATAGQWAADFDSIPPLSPMVRFYQPHLTLVKIWIAQNTPASRRQAAESLDRLKEYTEFTHNTVYLIEVLALSAVLHHVEHDEPAALTTLERAIEMAEPGGFVRLFTDLGRLMADLLHKLLGRCVSPEYVSRILSAFPESTVEEERLTLRSEQPPPVVVEPLTPREIEVLQLLGQRLTNKEIAKELVVSPETVKSHTLSIYAKLDVHSRRQAVDKARRMGLLSPR